MTDAAAFECDASPSVVNAVFAEGLERQLADEVAETERLRDVVNQQKNQLADAQRGLETALNNCDMLCDAQGMLRQQLAEAHSESAQLREALLQLAGDKNQADRKLAEIKAENGKLKSESVCHGDTCRINRIAELERELVEAKNARLEEAALKLCEKITLMEKADMEKLLSIPTPCSTFCGGRSGGLAE